MYDVWQSTVERFLQGVRIARNADPIAVIARLVCPSVTFRCFVQTNEDTIVRSSALDNTIILVSEEVKFIPTFAGESFPTRALKWNDPCR